VIVSADGPIETAGVKADRLPKPIPDSVFAHYFYVNDWNAFIYIAAASAQFDWLDQSISGN
jgi:hypothetical protein